MYKYLYNKTDELLYNEKQNEASKIKSKMKLQHIINYKFTDFRFLLYVPDPVVEQAHISPPSNATGIVAA